MKSDHEAIGFLPEHRDTDFFVDLFYRYGIGILGERGLPSPGEYMAALPLIKLQLQPNIDFLFEMFLAGASGLNEAAREAQGEREAARKK